MTVKLPCGAGRTAQARRRRTIEKAGIGNVSTPAGYDIRLVKLRWIVAVLGLAGATANSQQEPATAGSQLGIYFQFEQQPSPGSLAAMRKEFNDLFEGAGIVPVWLPLREAGRNSASGKFRRVVMVRFTGSCRDQNWEDSVASARELFPEPQRLAFTKVVNGNVAPWAEVECDSIKKALGKIPPKQQSRAFGSALARVLAHEVYHVLVKTTAHARHGLARPVVEFSELTAQGAGRFNADDLGALSNSFR